MLDAAAPQGIGKTTVGALCDAFGGEVQTGPFGSQLHASDYSDAGTPVVMPQDMVDGRVVCDRIARVSEAHVRRLPRHVLRPGDIVFSRRGDVGRFTVITEREGGWLCGTGSIRIRLNCPVVSVDYLRWYLQQPSVGAWLEHHAKGVTMPNLNTQILRALPLVCPPRSEQRRIAVILNEVDELRAKRRAALAQLSEMTRAIFVEMFGDPLSPPKQVAMHQLGTITKKIGSGATPTGGEAAYQTEGIALIRSMNVRDGCFSWRDLAYIDDAQARRLNGVQVEANDVLLNITGASVARVCRAPDNVLPARVNQHVSIIRPTSTLRAEYLEQCLLHPSYKAHLLRVAEAGATRQAITKAQIEELTIPVPLAQAQENFVSAIREVERLRTTAARSQEWIDFLFASLQHRAFCGEL